MAAPALIPEPLSAAARPRGRAAFAFTPRCLVLFLAGLILLIPAWRVPALAWLLAAWNLLLAAAWLIDLLRLPVPALLSVRRSFHGSLLLGHEQLVELTLEAPHGLSVTLSDSCPPALRTAPPALHFSTGSVHSSQTYTVLPVVRGDHSFHDVHLLYRGPLGLAERWALAPLSQSVCVLPDLTSSLEQALYLLRGRQNLSGRPRRLQRHLGRELESLRDYRHGDDPRDICWTATARRRQLITRNYESERAQSVWLLLDAGRLSRAEVVQPNRPFRLSRLDHSVNASLALIHAASLSGDRVGLLSYGTRVQHAVGAGHGPAHQRTLLQALALTRSEQTEARHAQAARLFERSHQQRALVVWISDFADTPLTPEVVEVAARMAARHLVLFAVPRQPDLQRLASSVPESPTEMFHQAAAAEIVERRLALLESLRRRGVIAIEAAPHELTSALVERYLDIKDRSLL